MLTLLVLGSKEGDLDYHQSVHGRPQFMPLQIQNEKNQIQNEENQIQDNKIEIKRIKFKLKIKKSISK